MSKLNKSDGKPVVIRGMAMDSVHGFHALRPGGSTSALTTAGKARATLAGRQQPKAPATISRAQGISSAKKPTGKTK